MAVAGGVLEGFTLLTGGALDRTALTVAFCVIAAITASSLFAFLTLSPNAGHAVSGHRVKSVQEIDKLEPAPETAAHGSSGSEKLGNGLFRPELRKNKVVEGSAQIQGNGAPRWLSGTLARW